MTYPASLRNPLSLFLMLVLLSGCISQTAVPELQPEDVPQEWVGPIDEAASLWPSVEWWDSFNNAELSALIDQVQASNLDLANNQRNLQAAQLALREAGFNLWPTPVISVGTGASYREIRGDSTDFGSIDDDFGNGGFNRTGADTTPLEVTAGFTYNDILSKPFTYERALADYDSQVALTADLALNTLGTAASTYFQLLLIRDRIEAAQQNVENAEAIGNIANARVEAGVAVPIEALQQQIALERERASLRALVQDDLEARAALALLLGRTVQGFAVEGRTLQTIALPLVQPGIPSELLLRRPDLVQAEANLRAAAANVDIVRSDLFPQISLTGQVSASSTSLTELLSSPQSLLTINANLVQTLLDNGSRFRNIEQARLSLQNSLANYRQAVLGAFNEVEVLLSNMQTLEQLGEVALRTLQAAEESFRIAQVRYEEGVSDFLTVLTAQNALFSSRNAFLDNKLLQLNAKIGFYQALGGGWQMEGSR